MEHFLEFAVTFLRSRLIQLLEREPTTFEDLHHLVDELLTLQDEFRDLVAFTEDIFNFVL